MFVVKDLHDDERPMAYFNNRENAEKYHCIDFKNHDGIDISQVSQVDGIAFSDKIYEDIPYCFYTVEAEGEIEYFDDKAESLRILNNHIEENTNDWEGYVAEREDCYPSKGERYIEALLWWQRETPDGRKHFNKYPDFLF